MYRSFTHASSPLLNIRAGLGCAPPPVLLVLLLVGLVLLEGLHSPTPIIIPLLVLPLAPVMVMLPLPLPLVVLLLLLMVLMLVVVEFVSVESDRCGGAFQSCCRMLP